MFSGVSIHQLWSLQVSTKINFSLNSFKKHLWREISQLQHRIITKRNSEAVFFLTATVIQVPKPRVGYTSCSRLQIHHSQQASTKHFSLWHESNINKDRFNVLLLQPSWTEEGGCGVIPQPLHILNELSEVCDIWHHLVERAETAGESERLNWLPGVK